jgi:hypothetical protein
MIQSKQKTGGNKMSRRKLSIIATGSLFILIALGATACGSVPNIIGAAQPTSLPTIVPPAPPTTVPESTPTPAPSTDAQGSAPKNARQQVLTALLKATGLEAGVVGANNNGTLNVRMGKGPVQVQTNASTIVIVPGVSSAKVSDIGKGDRVLLEFPNGDSTQPAAFVMSLPSDLTADNVRLGAVQANKRVGLGVRTRQGAEDLTTDSLTMVMNLNSGQPSLESVGDLQTGNAVVVIGTGDGSSFDAQVIVVLETDARNLIRKLNLNPPAPLPTPGM